VDKDPSPVPAVSTRVRAARHLFSPEGVYLNSATYGLPPRSAFEAMQAATDEWRHGRTGFDGWDRSVGMARATFARLHGVRAADVAVGSQASVFVGMIAASLPPTARVLCAEGDFTSLLYPFLAQGQVVEYAPLERLADAIDSGTAIVAVSAVQSSDGRLADLDAIAAAARHHGARVLIDSTQASGWLPVEAGRYDAVVCSGYKWLLGPRGTAYMAVRPDFLGEIVPVAAGWYATDDPVENLYGGPMHLSESARRLDVSPAWMGWVGAAPALRVLEEVGIESIHQHGVGLANLLRAGMDMEPSDSAIVSLCLDGDARDRLRAADVMAAGRGGGVRLSFHLYNDEMDVERALSALR
jgi:selenocysteine lyase/cysteine desulfurase